MNEALRGTRMGAISYETDDDVELAPRELVRYDCPAGHSFVVPFSVEAEIPDTWDCRFCRATALRHDASQPQAKAGKKPRTHWDMLMERRTVDDLEALLVERLALLRESGGPAGTAHPDHRREGAARKSA
jgi:rubredoxin